MLHYALGSAAEEHALITGISMGRDDNQVGFQFSSSCTNLVNSVSFADGDRLSFRYNETGNTNTRTSFTVLYQAP